MSEIIQEGKCECGGELESYIDDEASCSCHINPPCSKCTDERMVCVECGEIDYPETTPYVKSDYTPPIYYPKCDIDSGIDYTKESNGGWHIVTGTNRKGMELEEIKNKLGKFDKYHMFQFKYFTSTTFCASWTTS